MPWGRLDDSLYDHPKLDLLPADIRLACVGLWARAISWCNRFLSDGQVPRDRVRKLDGTPELAAALVAAGLFEEVPTGFVIHDFLAFNDSRTAVEERRQKEAKRKAEWRANRHNSDVVDDVVDNTSKPSRKRVPAGHRAADDDMSRAESRRPSRRLSHRDPPRAGAIARIPARPDPSESSTTPPAPSPARGRRNGSTRSSTNYDAFVRTDDDAPTAAKARPAWLDREASEQ